MANHVISEKLRAARKMAGLSQRDVYGPLGIKQSTFSSWETGAAEPDIMTFLTLCRIYKLYNVLPYFLGTEEEGEDYCEEERELILKYRALSEHGRAAVKACLSFEHTQSE